MSSTERGSLVDRVAWVTALVAGVVALVSASSALVVANGLVTRAEEARLRDAARGSLHEIETATRNDRAPDALDDEVREEVEELGAGQIALLVSARGVTVGGDPQLAFVAPGACASVTRAGTTLHACRVDEAGLSVTVGSRRQETPLSGTVLGLVTATLLAALVGRLVARRAALWALAPLTSLRTSLETIRAREPRDAKLGGDDRIAEVRELRVALGGLLSRLGDALDAARGFSAEAAHELRTPLTTLSAELDLLAEEELPQEAREAVGRLQRRTQDMTRLVERLLFLAEIEPLSEHGEPKGDLDLRDLAFRVVDSLPHGAKERVVVRGEGDVRVHGDDVLLGALVENLVDNALKFSEREVRLTVRPDGDVVVLEVADEGPGLATELDDQLFRPFVRGSDARARGTPGHGLGLGIVSRIAKAHGGEVSRVPVQSGATFRVRLPAPRA